MWWVLVVLFSFTLLLHPGNSIDLLIEPKNYCPPSSCGKVSNISYPFRLKHDKKSCGDSRYELYCENNVTTLHLYSAKYYVQSINYDNFTIRLVDPGIQQSNRSSSRPLNWLSRSSFCETYNHDSHKCNDPYHAIFYRGPSSSAAAHSNDLLFEHIVYLNCTNQVTNNPKYVNTSSFVNSNFKSKGYYIYAMAGDLIAQDFEVGCRVKLVTLTSWLDSQTKQVISYDDIHKALVRGFKLSWFSCNKVCRKPEMCLKYGCTPPCQSFFGYSFERDTIGDCGTIWSQFTTFAKDTMKAILIGLDEKIEGLNPDYDIYVDNSYDVYPEYKVGWTTGFYILPSFLAARVLFGITFFIALLIYKWRKRHWSMYECIELYLQQQNNRMPIVYSYNEIKKMVRGFKEKLGEGGFGTVFKGNQRSGPCVAIKMLGKSKGNGQDFINEVATIGRINHLNVVQLLGFCIEGSKRALVYEFMPNGSLDKFIFSKEGSKKLSCSQIHDISIGVARGIAYLHHGCEMKILHFDIKPHNILLDEKFIPKISDFGLAKLYSIENSIVTMTAARGTIGYMAPELFYKNIGGVSHKADVYSFGMLLMEMASKRNNLNAHAEHSSQLYFPLWIYDQFGQEGEIEIEDVTEEENKIVKKMIIVALWCIQLKPDDRPSMSKVVEMLEGDVESLEMPPKPILYPHEAVVDDQRTNYDLTMSSDDYTSSDDSVKREPNSLIENIA